MFLIKKFNSKNKRFQPEDEVKALFVITNNVCRENGRTYLFAIVNSEQVLIIFFC